ncbi:response regulator transcription factor [Variovorax sp. J22R115]|uniref:response regulator transcription factor n=2 Tax=Variovorax TaxID=34072 RepID=UPI0025763123|nr:response regulator [Variovorax sp. J22R115]MDM0050480.1 response regulator [Variovorax sp. J22R115]
MTSIPTRVVLVVDDDDSMRQAIERLLMAAGLKTATYASAEALLASGPMVGADCIVSDFHLPGMSGLDLLSELRRRGNWPPVIVITAHDAPQLRDEAMRRGASGYLAKPFHSKDLLAAIEVAVQAGAMP